MECPICRREFNKKYDVEFIQEQGICYECYLHQQEQETYIRITRDMAIDAGDPSLEGLLWRW